MRLIWGPLGTLLDLIFCHCEGYELASKSTFEDYMRWVRENEVPAQFFYADSAATVADNHYLSELAQRQRAQGASPGIERELAELALPLTPEAEDSLTQRMPSTSTSTRCEPRLRRSTWAEPAPMPPPPERCTCLPICAHEPTVAEVSTTAPSSTWEPLST